MPAFAYNLKKPNVYNSANIQKTPIFWTPFNLLVVKVAPQQSLTTILHHPYRKSKKAEKIIIGNAKLLLLLIPVPPVNSFILACMFFV